jgi:hypothetical protein
MNPGWTRALVAGAVGAFLTAGCLLKGGPLPGDVFITQALQGAFGEAPRWALFLTATAQFPWVWLTVGLAVAMAYLGGRQWRGGAAPALTFLGALLLDKLLRLVIFSPRPDPAIVAVAAISNSSGLPSTFGLLYGGLFGAVILALATGQGGTSARIQMLLSLLLLLIGWLARIVLGGHWASQMLASVALAFAVALLVQGLLGGRLCLSR